jgi:hypothetical protein
MQPSTKSAPRIANASAAVDRRVVWDLSLCATTKVVEPVAGALGVALVGVVVGVPVAGVDGVGVLVVWGIAPAGVVVAGGTVPGWVLAGAVVGLALVAVAVVVLVVTTWTRTEGGTVTPRIFFVPPVPPVASAAAGESVVIKARIAAHRTVHVRRKLWLALADIALAMLTAAS